MELCRGLTVLSSAMLFACGGGKGGGGAGGSSPDAAQACDPSCMDATALRSLRDAIKLVYNLRLQGQPVGAQDQMTQCPLGGGAHVFGQATSNGDLGTTNVELTYVFMQCAYSETDNDPTQTFSMTLAGTVTESGTIAVEPSSTTALQFQSNAMTFSGTVYFPPVVYDESACTVALGQNGGDLSGKLCGRMAGVTL
jgi:hypothetical protein